MFAGNDCDLAQTRTGARRDPAEARLPLFALDLRAAPEWFRQSRGSRQIGAVYPEGTPDAFIADFVPANTYDAVLFVDTTTVARKNP